MPNKVELEQFGSSALAKSIGRTSLAPGCPVMAGTLVLAIGKPGCLVRSGRIVRQKSISDPVHRHQPAGPVGVVLDHFTEAVDINIQLILATLALFSPDVIHQVLVGDTSTKVISQVKKDPELGLGKGDLQTVFDQYLFVRVQEAIVPKRNHGFLGANHNNSPPCVVSRNIST